MSPAAGRRWAASAAAAVCGLVNGVLVTRLKVVPFIVTLGMMLLVRGAAKGLADERRIEAPGDLAQRPAAHASRPGAACSCPAGIWIVARARARSSRACCATRAFGRHLFAIGSNERTARLCGVRVERDEGRRLHARRRPRRRRRACMQFAKLSVGDPTVAVGLELDVIAAVIIGGGSLAGGKRHRARHRARRRPSWP